MELHRKALEREVRRERQGRKEREGEIKLARAFVKGHKSQTEERKDYKAILKTWIDKIRDGYKGSLIRRTIKSVDWLKRPISGLERYREYPLLLELTPEEHRAQNDLAEEIENEGVTTKNLQVSSILLGFLACVHGAGVADVRRGRPHHEYALPLSGVVCTWRAYCHFAFTGCEWARGVDEPIHIPRK